MNEHAVLGECERGEDTATSSTLITENVPSPGEITLRPPASFHSHLRNLFRLIYRQFLYIFFTA